jgi:hypothetical protein
MQLYREIRAKALSILMIVLILPLTVACDTTPPSLTPTPLPSGGLGLTRAEWEQHHTFILAIPGSDYIYDGFNKPLYGYRVNFWQEPDTNDPAARISAMAVDTRLVLSDTGRIPPTTAATATLTKEQMQEAVRVLLLADAERQGTESPSGTPTFTETYQSNLLKTIYPPLSTLKDPWGDLPPGTIKVLYENGGPSVLITAGNATAHAGSPLQLLPTKTPGP